MLSWCLNEMLHLNDCLTFVVGRLLLECYSECIRKLLNMVKEHTLWTENGVMLRYT